MELFVPKYSENSDRYKFSRYVYAKYYLPITVLKIYFTSLIASALQSVTLALFIVVLVFDLAYFFYLLIVRPFVFMFSNIRLLILQIFFIIMNSIMVYYSYYSKDKTGYNLNIESALLSIIATTVIISIIMLCM